MQLSQTELKPRRAIRRGLKETQGAERAQFSICQGLFCRMENMSTPSTPPLRSRASRERLNEPPLAPQRPVTFAERHVLTGSPVLQRQSVSAVQRAMSPLTLPASLMTPSAEVSSDEQALLSNDLPLRGAGQDYSSLVPLLTPVGDFRVRSTLKRLLMFENPLNHETSCCGICAVSMGDSCCQVLIPVSAVCPAFQQASRESSYSRPHEHNDTDTLLCVKCMVQCFGVSRSRARILSQDSGCGRCPFCNVDVVNWRSGTEDVYAEDVLMTHVFALFICLLPRVALQGLCYQVRLPDVYAGDWPSAFARPVSRNGCDRRMFRPSLPMWFMDFNLIPSEFKADVQSAFARIQSQILAQLWSKVVAMNYDSSTQGMNMLEFVEASLMESGRPLEQARLYEALYREIWSFFLTHEVRRSTRLFNAAMESQSQLFSRPRPHVVVNLFASSAGQPLVTTSSSSSSASASSSSSSGLEWWRGMERSRPRRVASPSPPFHARDVPTDAAAAAAAADGVVVPHSEEGTTTTSLEEIGTPLLMSSSTLSSSSASEEGSDEEYQQQQEEEEGEDEEADLEVQSRRILRRNIQRRLRPVVTLRELDASAYRTLALEVAKTLLLTPIESHAETQHVQLMRALSDTVHATIRSRAMEEFRQAHNGLSLDQMRRVLLNGRTLTLSHLSLDGVRFIQSAAKRLKLILYRPPHSSVYRPVVRNGRSAPTITYVCIEAMVRSVWEEEYRFLVMRQAEEYVQDFPQVVEVIASQTSTV